MSTPSSWSDAQIHAYVDGELDAIATARLAADSHNDVLLAARIAQQRELQSLLRGAFDAVLEEPVPQRLRDALTGSAPGAAITAIGAAQKPRARAVWSLREWGAIAATLVLGVLIGTLVIHKPGALPLEMAQGQLLARGELDAALSSQLSGSAPDAATRVALSFRAASGAYCRTFSQRGGPSGIACRNSGRWSVQLLDAGNTARVEAAGDYRQARSALSPAMLGAITALGGGEALTIAQEQQQLSAGWQ